MLKRIWHALVVGHTPEREWCIVASPSCPSTTSVVGMTNTEGHRFERYGFTTYYSRCACGSIAKFRILGSVKKDKTNVDELEQLRKMAGLGDA